MAEVNEVVGCPIGLAPLVMKQWFGSCWRGGVTGPNAMWCVVLCYGEAEEVQRPAVQHLLTPSLAKSCCHSW